jgi:hypothetical protein
MSISLWIVANQSIETGYQSRTLNETTLAILDTAYDAKNVQPLYENPAGPLFLFNLNLNTAEETEIAIAYLLATYPAGEIATQGAWHYDTGVQLGQDYNNSNPPQLVGTPTYPIPANAWETMPPLDGVPATSNADLRDINLLSGQAPRIFEDT